MRHDRTAAPPHTTDGPAGCLAGARAWLITDGKAGNDVQARGIADALGLDYEIKRAALAGVRKLIAPWFRLARAERFGEPGTPFAPPWPTVAIGIGWASAAFMRELGRRAGLATYRVMLLNSRAGRGIADLIWVPEHDLLRGPNVFTTPTAPHSFTPERLAHLCAEVPAAVAALPSPRVAVMLGGKNGVYEFNRDDDLRLARALDSLGRLGASFMVTPSRRTHQRLVRTVEAATAPFPRVLWDGHGDNPYPHFLANADIHLVTADSVNMTGEAAATGRPVYVFAPSGRSAKFDRFHEAMRKSGATRPCPDAFTALESWSYAPLDSARLIAAEIERRWHARRHMVGGLIGR